MAENSKIEWTATTWNPVAGCNPVSRGCAHCYAARMAKRLAAMGQEKYLGTVDAHGRWTGALSFDYDALRAPYSWRKPRRVFVCSMSDLFHEAVPWGFIQGVFTTMRENPGHTFQVLTKRPERMRDYFRHREPAGVPRNVWLGVSVENQAMADERIAFLLECPAAVRFLSCEPLVGPVLIPQQHPDGFWPPRETQPACPALAHKDWADDSEYWLVKRNGIQWVICGGESGPKAAPMHPDWARRLRDQCVAAGVPFFFKQWGGSNKKLAGRLLDGREWNEMPGVAV